jgi:hypothetical protein
MSCRKRGVVEIKWPDRYHPSRTGVFVSNSLTVSARPQLLWAWLIRAQLWPTWYPNSADVRFADGGGPDLRKGAKFRWKTFGVTVDSVVEEFVPHERLAWTARGIGVDAYHAWAFEETPAGCRILTEETQNGPLARLGNLLMPNRMHRHHQIWLERLRDRALTGMPPAR